jgi:NADP-dependent 3-hydroxy acid dehydrogenase YdfG
MQGKVVVITGSNSGIGKETAGATPRSVGPDDDR